MSEPEYVPGRWYGPLWQQDPEAFLRRADIAAGIDPNIGSEVRLRQREAREKEKSNAVE